MILILMLLILFLSLCGTIAAQAVAAGLPHKKRSKDLKSMIFRLLTIFMVPLLVTAENCEQEECLAAAVKTDGSLTFYTIQDCSVYLLLSC